MGQFSLISSRVFLVALLFSLPLVNDSYAHGPSSTHGKLNQILEQLEAPAGDLTVQTVCAEFPTDAKTADGGLCDDLYRFSCAPGEWSDGTGSAGSDEIVRRRVTELKSALTTKATNEFAKSLKTTNGAYLKQLALSAFGMSYAPGCREPGKGPACDRNLSEALGNLVTKNLFPRGGE